MNTWWFFGISAAVCGAVFLLAEVYALFRVVYVGREVSQNARAYERIFPSSTHTMLVVGDSLGVGVGAQSPETSIVGRIAAEVPTLSITNMSKSGMRVAGARHVLANLPNESRYDIIFIIIGGNDVIRCTATHDFRDDIRAAFTYAHARAETVVLMSSGNVGNASGWGYLARWWFDKRTRIIRKIILEEVARANVVYVDVFIDMRADDPFVQQPQKYLAQDGLHPSDDGYALWYNSWKKRWHTEENWLGAHYRTKEYD